MTSKVYLARGFAIAAHEAVGQRRKYTSEPYWSHPAAVAALVEKASGTVDMIAAAWLHDVVEDTKVTIDVVRDVFGNEVATLVDCLTSWDRGSHPNRHEWSLTETTRLAACNSQVQTIKVADVIDNTKDLADHDPEFAKVYMREKLHLVHSLTSAAPSLRVQAYDQLFAYFAQGSEG